MYTFQTFTNSSPIFDVLLDQLFTDPNTRFCKLPNRLVLYQVLASLAFAIANVTEIIFVNYYKDPEAYNRVCNAIGLLVLYSEWTKLLFTLWVTFHLFCFGVLYKNMKKFEIMYVLTSLAVPAVIAIVPLVTKTYGVGRGGKCWIKRNSSLGIIEVISLWVCPAICIRNSYGHGSHGNQNDL